MKIFEIADLHFGKLPNEEELYRQLKEEFISKCNKEKPDIIVLAGDSYDTRVSVESKANIYYNKFIDDCIETGATIIVIEGTYTHDRFQINSLLHYASDKFIIVNTVTKLNVLGLKLLILPEEYVKGIEYYNEYLNDNYDFVFFHGMFSHVGFTKTGETNINLNRRPFTFDYKMFENNTKFYVVGGHIHTHSVYHKVIYGGSFGRLNFGEEEAKGFISLEINSKGDKCKYKFIENKQAQTFKDVIASELPDDVDNLIKLLRNYSEFNDYVRIVMDIVDDAKENSIKGFVKVHSNCAIKYVRVKTNSDDELQRISENMQDRQKKLNDQMEQYKDLNLIEVTQKIAKDEYHKDIEAEFINKVLNTDNI